MLKAARPCHCWTRSGYVIADNARVGCVLLGERQVPRRRRRRVVDATVLTSRSATPTADSTLDVSTETVSSVQRFTMRHKLAPPGTVSRTLCSGRAMLTSLEFQNSGRLHFGLDRPSSTLVLSSLPLCAQHTCPETRSRNACEDRLPHDKLDSGSVPFAAPTLLSDRGDCREPKVGETPMDSDDTFPLFLEAAWR